MFGHKKEKDASEPVILMNVAGNYELGLVKSILEEHQIPCFMQDHATGGYMRLYAASRPGQGQRTYFRAGSGASGGNIRGGACTGSPCCGKRRGRSLN